ADRANSCTGVRTRAYQCGARYQPPPAAHRADARGNGMSAVRDTRPVMILAGGTGGHIFPGLAVAKALRSRDVSVPCLGAQRGLETRLVPPHGVPIDTIAVRGVRGKGVTTLLAAPMKLIGAVRHAAAVLRARKPRAVIS